MKREFSAGGIVFNQEGNILLVQHSQNMHWGFPKGLIDKDKSTKDTAIREVKEEGGVEAVIIEKVGESKFFYTNQQKEKVFKVVIYYFMRYLNGDPKDHDYEVSHAGWYPPHQAKETLTYLEDKKLLEKALVLFDKYEQGQNIDTKIEKIFVSRGGLKLQAALTQFKIDINNLTCLDVGSSTGGFVDCLLQQGAKKVYAVDTAYGELAWKLRNDPRVTVLERTNILHLNKLPEEATVDIVTIDAGWTKLELVLPVIKNFLAQKSQIVALIKPQYEIEKSKLKKGVVPKEFLDQLKIDIVNKITQLGFKVLAVIDSPILGGGGNNEFLSHLTLSS